MNEEPGTRGHCQLGAASGFNYSAEHEEIRSEGVNVGQEPTRAEVKVSLAPVLPSGP